MDRFLQRQSLLTQHAAGVDQQTIDRLIQLPETPPPAPELSKGLNLSTLSMIREFLSAHPGESFTSEQIAAQVHLSRITVRRYVSHMVETHELESSIDYRHRAAALHSVSVRGKIRASFSLFCSLIYFSYKSSSISTKN